MERVQRSATDRAAGILLGLAAGDRNGGPIRMAVRLAESLAERDGCDVGDIAARYLEWWHDGAFDTGPTAAQVFKLVDSGMTFEQASHQVHRQSHGQTAGCNPAHRSTPLGMLRNTDNCDLEEFARREAQLTHRHPLAGDVAAAVVIACHELVLGRYWEDAIERSSVGRWPETKAALMPGDRGSLNLGGYAPDVLAAAVFFVGQSGTFRAALESALQFAGPANYCPVLVGSLAGARWGASNVDADMIKHCDILPRVQSAAIQLSARWD